ncbi:MAG: extracellular solute-binding protein [Chloroflexi bacterium]|nr:extracellular solute-binding protein [Chloroflexota bacterium]
MAGLASGVMLLAACQPAAPAAAPTTAPPAAPKPTTAAPAASPAIASASPSAAVNPSPSAAPAVVASPSPAASAGHMSKQDILDALKPFSGTTITASVIGSSPPPQDQVDALSAIGINTDFDQTPATDLFQKLIVDFASGSSSFDVITIIPNQIGAFAQYMLDLTDLNAKYAWPTADVLPDFRAYGWYPDPQSGKPYSMPYGGDLFLLHYRTDVFQMAGLEPSQPPATYDDMAQLAARFNNMNVGGTPIAGFLPRTSRALTHTWWANFFAAWGGDWFTADWKPQINSSAAQGALDYAVNLLQYGPTDDTSLGFVDLNNGWLNGTAAMSMHYQAMGTNAQFGKQSKVVDKTAVAELPAGPAGRRSALIGGQTLGIPAKSKNAEAAYLWARWLVQPENALETALAGTGVEPYWMSLFEDPRLQQGFTDGKNGWRAEISQASDKTLALPNIPEWPQLYEALDLGLSEAYVKQKSSADALNEVSDAWTQILTKANYYAGNQRPYNTQS